MIQYFKTIINSAQSATYWLLLIVSSLSLLAVALYYQYVLEELPCVMCIQVRLWLVLLVFIAFIGLISRSKHRINLIFQFCVVLIAAGLFDRSYQLLGTERGFVFSDCGFTLGLPGWLALEEWFPSIFRIETSCGYTPELLLGITMAEALIALSFLLVVASFLVFVGSIYRKA